MFFTPEESNNLHIAVPAEPAPLMTTLILSNFLFTIFKAFNNPDKNVSGSADRATYTQTPNQNDGVVFLTGSAHAVQNGNVLNAPELKLYLKDNSAETLGGRSTLVITPN